jgi:hypothetical protein
MRQNLDISQATVVTRVSFYVAMGLHLYDDTSYRSWRPGHMHASTIMYYRMVMATLPRDRTFRPVGQRIHGRTFQSDGEDFSDSDDSDSSSENPTAPRTVILQSQVPSRPRNFHFDVTSLIPASRRINEEFPNRGLAPSAAELGDHQETPIPLYSGRRLIPGIGAPQGTGISFLFRWFICA